MNKTRVLFIIDSLNCGGAEISLVSLLSQLDYTHCDVFLSIVSRGGVLEQNIPSEVTLLPFPTPFGLKKRVIKMLLPIMRRLMPKRHMAELRWIICHPFYSCFNGIFDIAVAYQQGFPTYYVADKVCAKKKIAWINTDLTKAGYRPYFNRPFYDKMTHICTVSDALFEMLPRGGYLQKSRLCVIKDIINVRLIREMSLEPFKETFIPKRIKILTVGRMVPSKNYPLAVETARLLSNLGIEYYWLFVGDGESCKEIEGLIEKYDLQDSIKLIGFQSNPYPYFASCDIYVSTSSFEGFGLTLSEAKVFHKPIVTTDFPSAFNQITDGENGLIARMTAESLAEKIVTIINNPDLKEHLIRGTEKEQNRTAETESIKVNQLLFGEKI